METCVLQQSLQVSTTNDRDTELATKGLTIQHQDNASTTDPKSSTAIINNRKSSSASLSDLIPASAAALRTRQEIQRNQYQNNVNSKANSSNATTTTTSTQDSSLNYRHQQQTTANSTPFARALTKVKLQVQTKRLKERYLSHEWIRLALGLPVDLSRINLHHCYYPREQTENNIGKQHKSAPPNEKTNTMTPTPTPIPASTLSSTPPSPAPSTTTTTSNSSLLDIDSNHHPQDNQIRIQHTALSNSAIGQPTSTTPPASPSSSRTGEIATWYEWKFDRSKFSVEEVQTKVDRLRTTKLRDKLASPS